jgi:hypothetical protein
MHLVAEAGGSFVVSPGIGFRVGRLGALMPYGGCGHCRQGANGFLFVGLLLGGLTWPLSALLIATPDTPWARAFYDADKMSRAT